MTIRVYIVDDHALVRAGVRMLLSGETDIEVVGESGSGEEALPQIRKLLPDVVLCDLHLPGSTAPRSSWCRSWRMARCRNG